MRDARAGGLSWDICQDVKRGTEVERAAAIGLVLRLGNDIRLISTL